MTDFVATIAQAFLWLWPIVGIPVVGWGLAKLQEWSKVKLDQQAKDNLHSALFNGVQIALQEIVRERSIRTLDATLEGIPTIGNKSVPPPLVLTDLTEDDVDRIKTVSVDYVKTTTPGAVTRFGLENHTLADMVLTKIPNALLVLSDAMKR